MHVISQKKRRMKERNKVFEGIRGRKIINLIRTINSQFKKYQQKSSIGNMKLHQSTITINFLEPIKKKSIDELSDTAHRRTQIRMTTDLISQRKQLK